MLLLSLLLVLGAAAGAAAAARPMMEMKEGHWGGLQARAVGADEVEAEGAELLGYLAADALGGPEGELVQDVWGWAWDGREFALVCTDSGVSVVDVTVPDTPVLAARLPTPTVTSWCDVKLLGETEAVVVRDGSGVGAMVFDLPAAVGSGVAGRRRLLFGGVVEYAVADAEPARVFDGVGIAHNVVPLPWSESVVLLVGSSECGGGLLAVDLAADSMAALSCFDALGYVHDAHCVEYAGPVAALRGRQLCAVFHEDGLAVVDASDVATTGVELVADATYDTAGYVHQGWWSDDHAVLFVDDELDEYTCSFALPFACGTLVEENGGRARTYVFRFSSDLGLELDGYFDSDEVSVDHNLAVVGDRVFQANYCSGLRVLEWSGAALRQVAFLDVAPDCDGAEFEGAWGVYPFLPSGNVLVSSIEGGLFVVGVW